METVEATLQAEKALMFSCRACKAKDGEIAFLRSMLSSARTIYRDPEREQTTTTDTIKVREVQVPQLGEPFNRNTSEPWVPPTDAPEGNPYRTEER
jgi:hypothetical protein